MVSQDFVLLRHSSPSFGSQHVCSDSNLSPKIMIGRWCLPRGIPTVSLSLRARVCHPNTRTYVRLLGPCFKTGLWQGFRPRKRQLKARSERRDGLKAVSRSRRNDIIRLGRLPRPESTGTPTAAQDTHPVRGAQKMRRSDTPCNSFPFSDFRHSLTLFSKFFASFPHGTCSLSVSRQYLALEGIYLPLRAAVPSNSTLRKNGVRVLYITRPRTGLSPSMVPCSKGIGPRKRCRDFSRLQFGHCCRIFRLSSSRFTRRYWGNPG